MRVPSKYQEAIYKTFQLSRRNISISAVAGSGKTTTLLELLKYIPTRSSSLFLAFNNSIVDELKKRNEREDVTIMTIHSCGWRTILQCYGSKIKMNPNKAMGKTEATMKHFNIQAKRYGYYFYNIPKVLDLMRCNLCENEEEAINELLDHYDINISNEDVKLVKYAFDLMNRDRSQFDFMDMIYVPVVDSYVRARLHKYDFIFCDESQDFSRAQQQFIKLCLNRRGRLVTVGDPRQAIYGFAGADAESYERLSNLDGEAIQLPLSVSYRCAKNIVLEAQKIVPAIKYAPDAPYGIVKQGSLTEIERGDWILCRNLKPLVQTYLWLLKNKIKSKIKGKDIGEGILALIDKTGTKTLYELTTGLEYERDALLAKLEHRGFRHPSLHPKMKTLEQRVDVIECLMNEVANVQQLKDMIANIFSDDVQGIMLSTIHKAKGLENETVYFLCPELIPSKFATQPWEFEQEENLRYVAITRAKQKLVYVSVETFINDLASKVTL